MTSTGRGAGFAAIDLWAWFSREIEGFPLRLGYLLAMKIYEEKNLDVCVNGKLRTVSLHDLLRLIVTGKHPALTKQGHDDFKKLTGLIAQIQIHGDWLLQSPWAVPTEFKNQKTLKR